MRIGIIGAGAIGSYVRDRALERGHVIQALLMRTDKLEQAAAELDGTLCVDAVADLPDDIEHMIDCAGHEALLAYGPDILRRGTDLTTVSLGALADNEFLRRLQQAAFVPPRRG